MDGTAPGEIAWVLEPGGGGGGVTTYIGALGGSYNPSPSTTSFLFNGNFYFDWQVIYESHLWREAGASLKIGAAVTVEDSSGNAIGTSLSWQTLVDISDQNFSDGPHTLSGGGNWVTVSTSVDLDPGKVPYLFFYDAAVRSGADARPKNPTGWSHVQNTVQALYFQMAVWENPPFFFEPGQHRPRQSRGAAPI